MAKGKFAIGVMSGWKELGSHLKYGRNWGRILNIKYWIWVQSLNCELKLRVYNFFIIHYSILDPYLLSLHVDVAVVKLISFVQPDISRIGLIQTFIGIHAFDLGPVTDDGFDHQSVVGWASLDVPICFLFHAQAHAYKILL